MNDNQATDNLYTLFSPAIARTPEKRAITIEGQAGLTYGELGEWSARLANALSAMGLAAGDRVANKLDKSPMALALHLACLRAGLVSIPVNPASTPEEVAYFLTDSQAALVVCQPEAERELSALIAAKYPGCRLCTLDGRGKGSLADSAARAPTVHQPVGVSDETVAFIIYTSGTTGRPKGVMLTHANLATSTLTISRFWGFTCDDVLLHPLPIFHAHGLFLACFCTLIHGCTMHFLTRFDTARVIELLPRSTVMMAVPTIYARLLEDPGFTRAVCTNMRLFTCGSAALTAELHAAFERRTGFRLLERYGSSETGLCTSNPLDGPRKPGSVGKPLPGIEVRLADADDRPVPAGEVGGVQARGDRLFAGYWGRPEETAAEYTADGFYKLGDLGRFDDDGYLWIVGRTKDLIITGGSNVYPTEVENALESVAGVSECAVFGVSHPDFGEAVVAAVVAAPDLDDGAIIEQLRTRLTPYKLPKRIVRLAELPRNAMGKVVKRTLTERYGALFSQASA